MRAERQLQRAARRIQRGDIKGAADIARAILDSRDVPGDTQLQSYLADLCLQCEMYFDASGIYESVWRQHPDDPSVRYKSGTAAYRTGQLHSARAHFEKCVELRPEMAASYLQLGHVYRALRDFDKAERAYVDYIARSEDAKGFGYWSLADLRRHEFDQQQIEAMRRHLEGCPHSSPEASIMQFALGIVAEQRKDYDQALQHYREANEIQAKLRPFRRAPYQRLLGSLLSARLEPVEAQATDAVRPIFVVGLPRSGTTLVEQILAAHSRVEATDELPYMERIALRMERDGGYGPGIVNMDDETRHALRARYLADASRHLRSDASHFIDKNPNNFLHIGLIRALFPEALVINVRRDLRDNAFSMYRQFFVAGHDHSASFADMEIFFEGYLRLMRFWMRLYPDAIHVQHYEALVRNPQEQIAGLLGFCGLPEEPGCFEFYQSRQAVMTPSAAQVSQPMYTSSIDYWRNFEQALGPEFERLDALQKQWQA